MRRESPHSEPVKSSIITQQRNLPMNWPLVGCAIVLLGGPIYAARLDGELRGDGDSMLAEVPADKNQPFAGTQSESRLRSQYHEPEEPEGSAFATPVASTAPGANEPEIDPAVMKKARKIYAERCASCHGDKGNGDGPGAFAIKPKPRDYTDPEWQKTVTDEELGKAIVKGGAAVGKSYMMPANYDLRSKPEVTAALVAMVRSFAQK
jgi:mono/diheme cytochrome c family protein